MSFGYLSLPIWVTMILSMSVYLVITGIKRRTKDRRALIIIYFVVALEGVLLAIDKLINELFVQFKPFSEFLSYIIIGLLIFIAGDLIFMGVTHKGDERSRRLLKIALLITIFSVVPLALWILIDLKMQGKLQPVLCDVD